MTDKLVLSEAEKELLEEAWQKGILKEEYMHTFENIVRAHVCKALDGIKLPKEENEYGEAESEREIFNEGFNTCLVEVKQAIQKAKEAYL